MGDHMTNPIERIRVVNRVRLRVELVSTDNGPVMIHEVREPAGYELQIQREGTASWEPIEVIEVEVSDED